MRYFRTALFFGMVLTATNVFPAPTVAIGAHLNSNLMSIVSTGGIGADVAFEYAFSSHFSTTAQAAYFGYSSQSSGFPSSYSSLSFSPLLRYYAANSLQGFWFSSGVDICLISYTYNSQSYDSQVKFLLPILVGYRIGLLDGANLWIEPYMGFSFGLGANTFMDRAINTLAGYRFGIGIGYSF